MSPRSQVAAGRATGVAVIIPAAGDGVRFGGSVAKALAPVAGEPLLIHALRALQAVDAVRWIVIVTKESLVDEVAQAARAAGISKALAPVVGGASRQESVGLGLAAVPEEAGWVLVHDAARPCLTPGLAASAIEAARTHGAVACGLPAPVTVKAVDEASRVRLTLDREHLWLVQTPQVFRRDWFAQALEQTREHLAGFPDDASMLEWAGFPVQMVAGDSLNLKVTTPEDRILAEAVLRSRAPGSAPAAQTGNTHANRNRLRQPSLRR